MNPEALKKRIAESERQGEYYNSIDKRYDQIGFILGLIALGVFYAVLEIFFHPSTMGHLVFGAFCFFCYRIFQLNSELKHVNNKLIFLRARLEEIRETLREEAIDLNGRLSEADGDIGSKLEEFSQDLCELRGKLNETSENLERKLEKISQNLNELREEATTRAGSAF
jgi:methyl-accepting chemotaxis protein